MLSPQMQRADAGCAAQLIVTALDKEKDTDMRWCLAAGLIVVVDQMEPEAAVRICGPAFAPPRSSSRPEGGNSGMTRCLRVSRMH